MAAIAASPNDGSQIDSLAELQSVVTSAVNAATANALSTISSYAGNNSASAPAQPMGTPPTLADYANAGVTGVDANNLEGVRTEYGPEVLAVMAASGQDVSSLAAE